MADTDDEQTAELEPDRRRLRVVEGAPGQEAAGEDRRAREWQTGTTSDSPITALGTADEEAEDEQSEAFERQETDQLEQDARAERELQDSRYQHDVHRADAEITEALRRARVAENAQSDLRAEAAGERRLARTDRSRAAALRDGAAGRDDPGADADRAEADRSQARANYQDRIANYDDATSDSYGAEARDRRAEAAHVKRPEPQPPAAEAVRQPPPGAPKARKNLKQRNRKTKELRDFGLGE
jgi:hypothetical protein